jgi:hypothetical protein
VVVVAAAVVGGDNGDTLDATGKPMSSVVSVVVLVVNVAVDLVDLVAFDFDGAAAPDAIASSYAFRRAGSPRT